MAEQPNWSVPKKNELKRRQNAVLNKANQLTSRVDALKRTEQVYDTSTVAVDLFEKLQKQQTDIFDRLIAISTNVNRIANERKVQLPSTNDITRVYTTISSDLEHRQKQSIKKLKYLTDMANAIDLLMPEIEYFITDKKEAEAEEEEDKNEYIDRKNELIIVSSCLKNICSRISANNTGKISSKQLLSVLEKVSLCGVDGSIYDQFHISQIIGKESLTNDEIDFNKFFDLLTDFDTTDKYDFLMASNWNRFRYHFIGHGRNDRAKEIQIIYRYDGWPEGKIINIRPFVTKDKDKILLTKVLKLIKDNVKDVEYAQLRYATIPRYLPGKRGWKPLDDKKVNEEIPFLINNDGRLEIDIWLRTQDFCDNKGGRPVPDDNDDKDDKPAADKKVDNDNDNDDKPVPVPVDKPVQDDKPEPDDKAVLDVDDDADDDDDDDSDMEEID